MTLLNNRISIGFTDAEWEQIQDLKRERYDKTYSQVAKELLLEGLKLAQERKKESSTG